MNERLPISEAALRLGIDYHQCRRLVLKGELSGGRDQFGRLYAESRAVAVRLADNAKTTKRGGRDGKARS